MRRARKSRGGVWLSVATAVVVTCAGTAAAAIPTRVVANPAPVASLEPAETAELWRRLVAAPRSRAVGTQAACRPLRAVFYAATDWLRLATKLAATPSPCAEYYFSIPAIVGNRTQMRPNAAPRIRALGPNFHAMAEIHFATWERWVASTGSSWHAAGVTARRNMAAAGYDVSLGDTWALNELGTAVRRGTGNARANIREFLRGLYEGDGRPTRGAALVVGFGQRSSDVSAYQTTLQNWLADSAFWADMATYVNDWTQEVYGDVRSWAAPGAPVSARREALNDYLQHKLVLANAGPPTIETARAYLRTAYSPLANATWERETGYGWTMVSAEQMASYVSAQVHALRYFSATSGQPQDHWGFAWAPRNGTGMSPADFAARTGLILDRLAAAIRDSAGTPDPADPGSAACGPPGQNVWCAGDVAGAALTGAWRSFRTWTQPALAFATAAQTIAAGTPSSAMSLAVVTSTGLPITTPTPLTVTLSSGSAQGGFSTSPSGPWTPTLALAIPAGTGTSPAFYYRDTRAGSHVLTASAAGVTSGTQTVTVTPGPLATLAVAPASASVRAGASQLFSARGLDAFGNAVVGTHTWLVRPAALGTVGPSTGTATTFTAARTVGTGTIVASVAAEAGALSASAQVRVTPGRLRIASIRYTSRTRWLLVSINTVDAAGKAVSRAAVYLRLRRDGRTFFTKRAVTGPAGRTTFRVRARGGRCFTAAVRRVSAAGFVWDGRTPRNRFCRRARD
jgi:hypothetical protein